MTLDDLEGSLCSPFQTRASVGAHHEKLNEHRSTLTATNMQPNDSSFWQY